MYTSASIGSLSGPIVPLADDPVDLAAADLAFGTAMVLAVVLALLAALANWLPGLPLASLDAGWRWQLGRSKLPLAVMTWLLVGAVVGLPLVSLVGKAGAEVVRTDDGVVRQFSATKGARLVLRSPWEHRREIGWSLGIGLLAAALSTGCGVVIGWALRTRRVPRLPVALMLATLFALPAPLIGVALIRLLNHPVDSPWAWLNGWYDHTVLAPVLAQFLRTLPLATLLVWSQLASIADEILDSAASEGANWSSQLLRIALPLRAKGILATFCLALIVAVGELAATLLVVPPGVSTLAIRIFGLLHYGAEDQVAAISLALGLATGAATLVVGRLLGWWQGSDQPFAPPSNRLE